VEVVIPTLVLKFIAISVYSIRKVKTNVSESEVITTLLVVVINTNSSQVNFLSLNYYSEKLIFLIKG